MRRFIVMQTLVAALAVLSTSPLDADNISHVGTNQKVLVICVKYDDITPRLPHSNDWESLLQTEVNNYFNQSTFNQTDFIFSTPSGGPSDGWYSPGCNSTDDDCRNGPQDVIDLVDPDVDFSQYHRVLVIYNKTEFGGQTKGRKWWRTDEGGETEFVEDGESVWRRYMTLSVVREWTSGADTPFDNAGSVAAHEIGHQLGLKTHYRWVNWFPDSSRVDITPWDLMGLSPGLNHFLAWAKYERGWIPGSRVVTVGPPAGVEIDRTVTLHPQETAGGTQLIQIPVVEGPPFFGYYVENRRLINGDERLPDSGVLVTLVDRRADTAVNTVVMHDPDDIGNIREAPLEVGDSYSDSTNNITITHVSETGDDSDVRVQYGFPDSERPNPAITPWGGPPWHTPDIWVDSQKNGWDTYRYVNASGEPEGNGDDAWVGHANRLYVRVRNTGPGDATNVRVQVYSNEPPGMGDAGADWRYRGTVTFRSIPSGGEVEGHVPWTPTIAEHTCVKAIIVDMPGEFSTLDNAAQENVTAFDTSSDSPYKPVGLKIRVNNPFETEKTPVHLHVSDIPQDWAVLVEPADMLLNEGGHGFVTFKVFPSGYSKEARDRSEERRRYQPGFIGRPKIEALVPYADTYVPIGGVEMWTHLVHPTELKISCRARGRLQQQDVLDTEQQRESVLMNEKPDGTDLVSPREVSTPEVPPKKDGGKARDGFQDYQRLLAMGSVVRPEPAAVAVPKGQPIGVRGRLIPAIPGAVIAVEFSHDKERAVRLVKADDDGVYRASLKEPLAGVWQAKAFYDGNRTYGKSESDFCRFAVK